MSCLFSVANDLIRQAEWHWPCQWSPGVAQDIIWCLHMLMHVYTNIPGHTPDAVCYSVLYLVKPQVFLSLTLVISPSKHHGENVYPPGRFSLSRESVEGVNHLQVTVMDSSYNSHGGTVLCSVVGDSTGRTCPLKNAHKIYRIVQETYIIQNVCFLRGLCPRVFCSRVVCLCQGTPNARMALCSGSQFFLMFVTQVKTVMLFSWETAKGLRVLIVPPEVFVFVYLLLAMLNG